MESSKFVTWVWLPESELCLRSTTQLASGPVESKSGVSQEGVAPLSGRPLWCQVWGQGLCFYKDSVLGWSTATRVIPLHAADRLRTPHLPEILFRVITVLFLGTRSYKSLILNSIKTIVHDHLLPTMSKTTTKITQWSPRVGIRHSQDL